MQIFSLLLMTRHKNAVCALKRNKRKIKNTTEQERSHRRRCELKRLLKSKQF